MRFQPLAFGYLFLLLLVGCGPNIVKTEVEEISVGASGVELQEAETLDPAANWATWRGPTGDGHAVAKSAPTEWDGFDSAAWVADIPGRGHSSPIVVGDRVLLASADENAKKQMVLAYDRTSGEKLWEKVLHEGNFPSKDEMHEKATHANGTLASDGKHAFISFLNNNTVIATALDLDGEVVWQKEIGAFSSRFGYAASPVLYKSFVIFSVDTWGGAYLAALDAATGEIAWRITRASHDSHSTPLVASVGGKDQLLISGCNEVCSYDPATGDEIWKIQATSDTTCGTMVTDGERVFASGGYPAKQTICISAEGEKLWDNKIKIYEPSMLLVDGFVYAVSDGGIAYCWAAEDGKEQWKKRLSGNFSSSPTLCNGNIYVSDLGGKTRIFKASSESYEEVAVNELGSDCYASPAILEGEIFMRVGDGGKGTRTEKLVCIRQ